MKPEEVQKILESNQKQWEKDMEDHEKEMKANAGAQVDAYGTVDERLKAAVGRQTEPLRNPTAVMMDALRGIARRAINGDMVSIQLPDGRHATLTYRVHP